MKRLVAFILIISLTCISLIGCSYEEIEPRVYIYGFTSMTTGLSYEKLVFDTSDVTLELKLGLFYREEGKTLDELKNQYLSYVKDSISIEVLDSIFVIYASKDKFVQWSVHQSERLHSNTDNAVILKIFTLDEVFENDFSYTSTGEYGKYGRITYNNSTKVTVPEEFFDTAQETIYISVYRFDCLEGDGRYFERTNINTRVKVTYQLQDKTTMEIIK